MTKAGIFTVRLADPAAGVASREQFMHITENCVIATSMIDFKLI
jgi:hypothetical protein